MMHHPICYTLAAEYVQVICIISIPMNLLQLEMIWSGH
jgi:hypothetical protein